MSARFRLMEPEQFQMDIYEVFWDARPALKAINAKVGGGDLSAGCSNAVRSSARRCE